MREIWKPVVGYEGHYEVSNYGDVASIKSCARRVLSKLKQRSGHLGVPLCLDGIKTRHRIHVLVAEAFIGPRPPGLEVRHLDGDPTDNRVSNLRYGTASDNRLDTYVHRARPTGEKSHLAKISNEAVQNVRALQGLFSSREVGLKFGVSDSYVRELWRDEKRRHDMRERDVESALVERVAQLKGEVRKVAWPGRVGAPDRLVFLKGHPAIFVELKRPGGRPRPSQLREHERLRAVGQTVLVIDTLELINKHFPLN